MNARPKSPSRYLDASAASYPDKVALVHDGARVTYRELLERSDAAAGTLRELGIGRGDRVAFAFPNGEAYVELYYGILKAAAVAVPLNTGLRREQMDKVIATLEPKLLLVATQYRALFPGPEAPSGIPTFFIEVEEQALPALPAPAGIPWRQLIAGGAGAPSGEETDEDALASIIYTSGSTADPKGVMLSHRNIAANTESIRQYLQIGPEDCQMVVLPFYYVMGKSLLNTHIRSGAKLVINNRFTSTSALLSQMIEEGVTAFSGVPSTYAHLLHRSPLELYRDRLGTLRYCTQAGGHMPRETKFALKRALPPHTRLYVMYGATEASARLTYLPPERLEDKPDSIGIPIPGVTVKILGPEGAEVADGSIGEIVAQGENIMLGYFRDPAATRLKLCDQGLRTGDMGYRDRDGFIHLVGRNDDMLKIRGHRISPQEIAEAIMRTRLISETFVYSIPDNRGGGRIEAIAVPIPDHCREADVLASCRQQLPLFKCPRRIHFVDSLPKFANGKIDRYGCEKLAGRVAAVGAH